MNYYTNKIKMFKISANPHVKIYHGSNHIYDKFDAEKVKNTEWGSGMYFSTKLTGEDSADSYGEYIYSTWVILSDLYDVTTYPTELALAVGLNSEHYVKKSKSYNWHGQIASDLMDLLRKKGSSWLNSKDIINKEIKKMGYDGLYIPFRNWVLLFNPGEYDIKRDIGAEKHIVDQRK